MRLTYPSDLEDDRKRHAFLAHEFHDATDPFLKIGDRRLRCRCPVGCPGPVAARSVERVEQRVETLKLGGENSRVAELDREVTAGKRQVPLAEALGPAALLERLVLIDRDFKAAGRIGKLDMLPDRTSELVIACAF